MVALCLHDVEDKDEERGRHYIFMDAENARDFCREIQSITTELERKQAQ